MLHSRLGHTNSFFCIPLAAVALDLKPLADPIVAKIVKGDIVVEVIHFVRAPQTSDSVPLGVNIAYARVQSLLPVPDSSGRLALNDLREQDVDYDDSMFPAEMGLASFAFHPDFSKPGEPGFGKLYTAHSVPSNSGVADYLDDNAGSHESVVREWTATDPALQVHPVKYFVSGNLYPS